MKSYFHLYACLMLNCLVSCTGVTNNSSTDERVKKKEFITIDEPRSPVYFTDDQGISWNWPGFELPPTAQVSFIQKLENEIIVATDNMGLFISEHNLTDWYQVSNSLPDEKINALYLSGNTIFVGVYNQGIFESNDRGVTWNSLNYDLTNLRVRAIVKLNHQLFVGTDDGIFKFNHEQKTWSHLFKSVQANSFNVYKGNIVAGTNFGVLLSSQSGEKWNWIHELGAVNNTAILDGKIAIMYFSGDVYMSNEWGSWFKLNYSPRELSYVYEMEQVDNSIIMSNNYGIHQSFDDGKSWKHILKTEDMAFMDFIVIENTIYGGTKSWNESRKKSK
ncbi:hypothetical protein [Reichenbachiella sp. MALMAid0571]|uniref:WD40/YVTN/BNR-like repeat-containing protein n=1 Tax=Reichenbachiella sp. MALMAid0571 TaxID=3143939 RepID=UPI0032DFDFA3